MKAKLKSWANFAGIGALLISAAIGIEWIHLASERDLGMPLIVWIVVGSLSMVRAALEDALWQFRLHGMSKGIRYVVTPDGIEIAGKESERARDVFNRIEAVSKRTAVDENGILLISAEEFAKMSTDQRYMKEVVYDTSMSSTLTLAYRGRMGNVFIVSLLPADPPKQDSPSE